MDILSLGEALIDFKQRDGLTFTGFEGGSPLNVTIAASRLGAKVGFGGQISNDLFGEALRNHLNKNEIDCSFLLTSDAPSTLAFVAEIDGDAHFSFIGNGTADQRYDPQPRPRLPSTLKFLQFGSISLLYEPTSSAITDIVARHQDEVAVVLDPNVRPALIADKDAYQAKLEGWVSLSDIVKVSTQDLTWLYPDKSTDEVAGGWLDYGAEVVLVTNGEEGVTLHRAGIDRLHAAAPKVDVVDTVGAGDTFTGALMVALLDRDVNSGFTELDDAAWLKVLSFATAAAALNCTRAGANPPSRSELDKFLL